MTKHLGTLWLLGFIGLFAATAGCIETAHDRDRGGGGASCPDYQYFTVTWGIDHGQGTIPLTCAQIATMASHVELLTNEPAPDDVLIPSYNLFCDDRATCKDGSPCNMSADTASGLDVGTYVTTARLVGSDATVLSISPGQGAGFGITPCDGWVLPYTFMTL